MKSKYHHLKERCFEANLQLPQLDLVIQTFGNVSVVDRENSCFAIKPSGVPYPELKVEDIVIVDFNNQVIDGDMNPSSDTKTHAYLYTKWNTIGSIVHTHSSHAVAWAQAQMCIPILGTTHADHLVQDIPCVPPMRDELIKGDYEHNTGIQIVEWFSENALDPLEVEMVLVGSHGPFTWGKNADSAVYNANVLEELAKMAYLTLQISPQAERLKASLIAKHFQRKHGSNAYYGQK
ncbi:L-ribulose-5-phosphate 4-epimerase [Flagellimonas sp.]|uniref:L-ribulose-5-phosphate 4-epimerase n=1 Tax=Flagellimonas sp. TaxID=2058762 RepID=UPI003B522EC6